MFVSALSLAACTDPSVEAQAAELETDTENGELTTDSSSVTGHDEPRCIRDDTRPPSPSLVVYLNFDGATLVSVVGADDPSQGRTGNTDLGALQTFEPTDSTLDRDCILQAVRDDFGRFDVWVTDRPPETQNYSMVIVSPRVEQLRAGYPAGIIGPLDCGNEMGDNIVAVTTRGPRTEESQAGLISAAVAQSLGVMRAVQPGEVMHHRGHTDENPTFLDQCVPLSYEQQGNCFGSGNDHCPVRSQNSVAELQEVLRVQ